MITTEFEVYRFVAGLIGAITSMKFVKGLYLDRALMALGGTGLAYFGAAPFAEWVGVPRAAEFISFLMGLLGMTVIAKLVEAIQAIDAVRAGADIWTWIKRRLGLE